MRVFRLSKRKFSTELSGKGAAKSANRWNSKGTEIIYTAESRALAMAEVAVHLTIAALPRDYVMIEIDILNTLDIIEVKVEELDTNWNTHPPHSTTQKLGDNFINTLEACILKVPSAVVLGDSNYLINPHHPDFKHISIVSISEFPFDQRLFK